MRDHQLALFSAVYCGESLELIKDVLESAEKHFEKEIASILNFQATVGCSKETETPLSCASKRGDKDIVAILLSYKETDPTLQNNTGFTALHRAAISGDKYLEIVKMLINCPHLSEDERALLLSLRSGGEWFPGENALDTANRSTNCNKELVEVSSASFSFFLSAYV